jgi:hypothetical protein
MDYTHTLDQPGALEKPMAGAAQPGNRLGPISSFILPLIGRGRPSVVAPTLEELSAAIGPMPPNSLIIGYCEDGLHIFLDLNDPTPGSLLIAGDAGCGKTRLLGAVLRAAMLLNTPRQVRFSLLSARPEELGTLTGAAHCYVAAPVEADAAARLVHEFVELAEQRRTGRQLGATLVLAIDDLLALLNQLNPDELGLFYWLVRNGPEARIWTVATLGTEDLESLDPSLLNLFGTRLLGRMANPEVGRYLSGGAEDDFAALYAGAQFSIYYEGTWVKFWVPGG